MIRRRSLSPSLRSVLALLALTAGGRLSATEDHGAANPTPAEHPTAKAHSADTKVADPLDQEKIKEPAASEETTTNPKVPEETKTDALPKHSESAKNTVLSKHDEPQKKSDSSKKSSPKKIGKDKASVQEPGLEHAVPPSQAVPEAEEIQSLLKLAPLLSERGDFESAEIAYYQVLNNPKTPTVDIKTALLGLARSHRKQGSLTKAAAIYERFLKDYPGDDRTPDALLDLGRTLRALGVYKAAITRFYSVINSTLKLPTEGFEHYQVLTKTAQFEIAETHFQSGDFAEAAKFYLRLRLLDLAPGDRARAHFKAAYSLKLKGDLENAVTNLRAYIDQWPDDENVPEARYLLAVTLRELKRPQEAFVTTLELLRAEQSRTASDPKRWAYWQRRTGNQLANDFFESGNTLNAHAIYTGLVDLSTELSWRLPLTYQIGLCYERLGIVDRARTSYQTIIDATGATPPAELAEINRMAAWRIKHLSWRDDINKQVTSFFENSTGKQPVQPAASTLPPAVGQAKTSGGAAPTPTTAPTDVTPNSVATKAPVDAHSVAPKNQEQKSTPTATAAAGAKTASTP